MTTIKLPPLPTLPWLGYDPERGNMHGLNHGELRARDLEVTRVVLEAAAKVCGPYSHGRWFADKIKKLEIKHE